MNKTSKVIKYIDRPLFLVTIVLFVFGLIMVFSASNVTAYMQYSASPYHYFINQGIFLFIGLILFLIMIRFNTKFYGVVSYALLIGLIASLVALLIVGKAKNQAVSWFDFGAFSFQPSEFLKVITIFFLAYYYDENKSKLKDNKVLYLPMFICAFATGLIMLQPDLGTAIIYTVIVALIFFAQPMPKITKFKLISLILGAVVVLGLVIAVSGKSILLERQAARFNFARPCDRLLTDGNQVCNGYIAINNGGLWGKGLGNSTQKYLYLPEPYTDFIFTILVEELGAIVGIIVILLYIFILYRILLIGRRSYTNRGTIICYGVSIYIFLHIAINLLGIMGLMPLTGVPLPFMSYGGSFTICLIAALTAVQSVAVETGNRKDAVK